MCEKSEIQFYASKSQLNIQIALLLLSDSLCLTYRKSSIMPRGAFFVRSLKGGLNRDEGLLEKGAYSHKYSLAFPLHCLL